MRCHECSSSSGREGKAPFIWLQSSLQEKFICITSCSLWDLKLCAGLFMSHLLSIQPVAWHWVGTQTFAEWMYEWILLFKASWSKLWSIVRFPPPPIMAGLLEQQMYQYPKKTLTFCHSQERVNSCLNFLKRLPYCCDLILYSLSVNLSK